MTEPPHRSGQDHDGLLHRPALTPALSAEEWDAEAFDGRHGFDHPGARFEQEGYSLEIMPHGFEEDPSKWITLGGHDMQRLAALCLYGKPFGFTREDVELLRAIEVVQLKTADLRYGIASNPGLFIDKLADRIESLLPPA